MNRFQSILSVFLISAFIIGVWADSDNDSNESGSGSDDSNDNDDRQNKPKYADPPMMPYPNYHFNQPVYLPHIPPPSPAYGGPYYPPPPPPPPMPYYYGYQPPIMPYGNPYPYGGYYNQPVPVMGHVAPGQYSVPATQAPQLPQDFAGLFDGSTINHSVKVNKEYQKDGHHYRSDGNPAY